MYRLTFTILLLFISLPSLAHGGHDHSVPMAGLIHLLWIAPILIAAVFLLKKLMSTPSKCEGSFSKKKIGTIYDDFQTTKKIR